MKKYLLMALAAFALATALPSCAREKGGTIVVVNDYQIAVGELKAPTPIKVSVKKGLVAGTPDTDIKAGETLTFSFDEDGTYAVGALIPVFAQTVYLSGGDTKTVTVK
jgi:hypothetical protein